jgi:proteasome lid subunit RPN8/RPN11
MTDTPWIKGPIRMRRDALDAVRAHAMETYPSECCGFLSGPASDGPLVDATERAVNEADRYHALDPERFPRTSKTYFKMNEMKAGKALERGAASGQPVKVIYHSHCDAAPPGERGDYFSAEDAATFAQDNQRVWPCAFLVVSVENGEAVGQRVWVHRRGTNEFDEAVLEIE